MTKIASLFFIILSVFTGTYAQNVGIGTSNPGAKLHVASNAGGGILIGPYNNQLGYNGIGTAPELAIRFTGYRDVVGNVHGAKISAIRTNICCSGLSQGTELAFFTQETQVTASGDAGLTERLRIGNGGNVGIGTSLPEDKLHVEGSIRMVDGNQQAGYIPVSDANGKMTWTSPSVAVAGDNLGNHTATTDIVLNNNNIYLRGTGDTNHGLGWRGTGNPFSGDNVDGPVLFGNDGGGLGTTRFGERLALVWENDGAIGVGTVTPNIGTYGNNNRIDLRDGTGALSDISQTVAGTTGYPALHWVKQRGTLGSPSAVNSNDILGRVVGALHNGSGYSPAAQIIFQADGTISGTSGPGAIRFFTTAENATSLSERMTIKNSGNVGIGTTSPADKLHVEGSIRMVDGNQQAGYIPVSDANGKMTWTSPAAVAADNLGNHAATQILAMNNFALRLRGAGDGNHVLRHSGAGSPAFAGENPDGPVLIGNNGGILGTMNGGERAVLRWTRLGHVGIGINPVRARLEVSGSITTNIASYGYLSSTGATGTAGGTNAYSIYAHQRIAASEFNAFSDSRIKDVIGRSDSKEDLETLNQIKITDYSFIDKANDGFGQKKKLIAQELKEVYPIAVDDDQTRFVPDVMKYATTEGQWIRLDSHTLTKGDKVRLIFENATEELEVLATQNNQFKVATEREGKLLVYGREVNDFHTVDYDALVTLNISATQELIKRLSATEELVQKLSNSEEKNTALEAKLIKIEQQLNVLMSQAAQTASK